MSEITPEFVARLLQRVVDEQRLMRDGLIVDGGRIETLATIVKHNIEETRYVGRQVQRLGECLRRLEERDLPAESIDGA